jgi:hypothetical protein
MIYTLDEFKYTFERWNKPKKKGKTICQMTGK